jgi:type IV/VI secretion system ImpK/VasF family protein
MKLTNRGNHRYQYPRPVTLACAEVVVIITDALDKSSTYNLPELHESICTKFDAIIKVCRAGSLPDSAARELLYPLAALADETFLSIPHCRYYWSERPLQLRYFGETAAGTKFFSRLEAHMNAKSPKSEILELYFIGLALGLKGMYGVDGARDRRCLKIFEDLGIMLKNIRGREEARNDVPVPVNKRADVISWMMPSIISLGLIFLVMAVTAAVYLISRADLFKFLDRF